MPSIIVPARNGSAMTARCLETILFSVSALQLNCEFVLVDDDSAPEEGILDVFRQHRGRAQGHVTKIIRSRKHQHYSGVFSIGLHHTTRDAIFFISNDMMVTPTFLQALLLVSSLSRDFGVVRGTSNYTDSYPEHQVEPPAPLKTYNDVVGFSRDVFAAHGGRYVEDQGLSGDAILLKRALVERIGVLDMQFFGYFGDPDYGMRAHLAGYKLVCAKGAWLFHDGAGHVKRDVMAQRLSHEQAMTGRMALVDTAYHRFRKKWAIETPVSWAQETALGDFALFDIARARASDVALKCEIPASTLADLEIL